MNNEECTSDSCTWGKLSSGRFSYSFITIKESNWKSPVLKAPTSLLFRQMLVTFEKVCINIRRLREKQNLFPSLLYFLLVIARHRGPPTSLHSSPHRQREVAFCLLFPRESLHPYCLTKVKVLNKVVWGLFLSMFVFQANGGIRYRSTSQAQN